MRKQWRIPNNRPQREKLIASLITEAFATKQYSLKDEDYGNLILLQGKAIDAAIETIHEDCTLPIRWSDISYTFTQAYGFILKQNKDEYARYNEAKVTYLFWKSHFSELVALMVEIFTIDVNTGKTTYSRY